MSKIFNQRFVRTVVTRAIRLGVSLKRAFTVAVLASMDLSNQGNCLN